MHTHSQILTLTGSNTLIITIPPEPCFSSHSGVSIRLKDSIIIHLATPVIAGNHKEVNSYRSTAPDMARSPAFIDRVIKDSASQTGWKQRPPATQIFVRVLQHLQISH